MAVQVASQASEVRGWVASVTLMHGKLGNV